MMEFRRVRDSIRRLLAEQAAGHFRVLGLQKVGKGAAAITGNNSLVEVYYSEGALPKSGGALTGPVRHNATYRIALTVSEAAGVDVAAIEAEGATAEQIANAIVSMRESGVRADVRLDALFERVYQILMDARNMDLGLAAGDVASRWISALKKDEPSSVGDVTVLTGMMELTCSVVESVSGVDGIAADPEINATIAISDEDETSEVDAGIAIDTGWPIPIGEQNHDTDGSVEVGG